MGLERLRWGEECFCGAAYVEVSLDTQGAFVWDDSQDEWVWRQGPGRQGNPNNVW